MLELHKNENERLDALLKLTTRVRSNDPNFVNTPQSIAVEVDKFYKDITHNFQLSLDPIFMFMIQFYDEAETVNGNLVLKNICTVNVIANNADEAVVKAVASMGSEVRKQYRVSAVTDVEVQKLMVGKKEDHVH